MSESQNEIDSMRKNFCTTDSNVNKNDSSCEEKITEMNQLKYLSGTFKSKLNAYYSCLCENASLTHKAHLKSVQDDEKQGDENENNKTDEKKKLGKENLSCIDLYVLKNPEELKNYTALLEKKLELQEHLMFWLDNEQFFWKWMV